MNSKFVQTSSTTLQSAEMLEEFKGLIPNLNDPDPMVEFACCSEHLKDAEILSLGELNEKYPPMHRWIDKEYHKGPDSEMYNAL